MLKFQENQQSLEALADIILEWNSKINVTAVRDRDEFIRKNIMDSLTLCGEPELEDAACVLDLGTGGGFPGLPLAIVCPDKSFVLVDSVAKKLKVIDDAAERLGLKNVRTVHGRAEDLASDPQLRESFDLVVSRAVANMSTLCEYCLPFVKVGGSFAAYKTWAAEEEILAAKKAVITLGGLDIELRNNGSEADDHLFAVVKKARMTPSRYPRKAGIPGKQPL